MAQRLEYKSKKWDKEIKESVISKQQSIKEHNYELYGFRLNELYGIRHLFQFAAKDKLWIYDRRNMAYGDAVGFYHSAVYGFMLSAEECYEDVCESYIEQCADIIKCCIELSAECYARMYHLVKIGVKTNTVNLDLDIPVFGRYAAMAVAIGNADRYKDVFGESIIMNLYLMNTEKARELIEKLDPPTKEWQPEHTLEENSYIPIFNAIIEKNAVKFRTELEKHIKYYRKAPAGMGYLTPIDYISAAMIKIAENYGITGMREYFDIIELPHFLFETNTKADPFKVLPERIKPYLDFIYENEADLICDIAEYKKNSSLTKNININGNKNI